MFLFQKGSLIDCNKVLSLLIVVPVLLTTISADIVVRDVQDPFEAPYFNLSSKTEKGPLIFNPGLKYPPYLRCITPTPVHRRDSKKSLNNYIRKNLTQWRKYWSLMWSRIYFEDEDVTVTWDYERGLSHPNTPNYGSYLLPIFIAVMWITVLVLFNVLFYPVIGLCLFRALCFVWLLISHKNIKKVIRWVVIRNARLERNAELRVYEDAGKHPPFSRYHLPKPIRIDEDDVVPKEMDESGEEFWASDDESENAIQETIHTKLGPDTCPRYQTIKEGIPPISDDVFNYFISMKKHGMFAVWTHGYSDLNLAEISKEHASLYRSIDGDDGA